MSPAEAAFERFVASAGGGQIEGRELSRDAKRWFIRGYRLCAEERELQVEAERKKNRELVDQLADWFHQPFTKSAPRKARS